ncbi:hypothetical protein IFR05_011510 [Cadophora sp. M221]|nr:hypothetical protein IFR05_011510 [Cadophora sp. M221]
MKVNNMSGNSDEFGRNYMGLLLTNTEANYIVSKNYTTLEIEGCNISSLRGDETFELSDLGNTTRPHFFLRPILVDPRRDHLVIESSVIDGLELCSAWFDLHKFKNIALYYRAKAPLEAARGVREFANRHSHLSKLHVIVSERHYIFYQKNYCFLEAGDNLPAALFIPHRNGCCLRHDDGQNYHDKIMAEKAKADNFNDEMAVLATFFDPWAHSIR